MFLSVWGIHRISVVGYDGEIVEDKRWVVCGEVLRARSARGASSFLAGWEEFGICNDGWGGRCTEVRIYYRLRREILVRVCVYAYVVKSRPWLAPGIAGTTLLLESRGYKFNLSKS